MKTLRCAGGIEEKAPGARIDAKSAWENFRFQWAPRAADVKRCFCWFAMLYEEFGHGEKPFQWAREQHPLTS
jgi:hypothetical protein